MYYLRLQNLYPGNPGHNVCLLPLRIMNIRSLVTSVLLLALPYRILAQDAGEAIAGVVKEIRIDSIESTIRSLQGFGSRFLLNPNRKDIALFLEDKFSSYGFDNIRIDSFESHIVHASGLDTVVTQYNVVATLPGTGSGDGIIVYGAHYDSYSTDTDPLVSAPGADDNASGTAAVIETARVIKASGMSFSETVEFVLFASEEYMLSAKSGSEYYAEQVVAKGDRIVLMINNDMISYNDGLNTICISDYPECSYATRLATDACMKYTNLRFKLWPSDWPPFADVEPFHKLGAQCVYIEEKYFNPYYHTSNDLTDYIDFGYCCEVARLSCGLLLTQALTSGIEDTKYNPVRAFPNPSRDMFTVQLPDNIKIVRVFIYDISGTLISASTDLETVKVDASGLNPGLYILRTETTGGIYYTKLVKSR